MTPRRSLSLASAVAVLLLSVGLGVGRSNAVSSRRGAAPAAKSGREALAVVTSDNLVLLARLTFNSKSITPEIIGPLTQPTDGQIIQVDSLVSSPDGKWLAWNEIVESKKLVGGSHSYIRNFVVLRNELTGHRTTVAGHGQHPIGFAGDTLITAAQGARRLSLAPSPHLVSLHDQSQPQAAYRHGVVDVATPPSKRDIERLRLTSMSGEHVVLHDYSESATSRSVGVTAVSGDENRLAVERGDHTDFGGIGPSSVVDLFRLSGSHSRTKLGHVGTATAGWRVGIMSFAGTGDELWAAWYKAGRHVQTRLTRHVNGKWKVVDSGVITVAGNTMTGDVVYQPGRFKPVPADIRFVPVASRNAVIIHRGHAQSLGLKALEFAWAAR